MSRVYDSLTRMAPSHQRFQSNDPPIARIDLRLVMQHELLLVEGTTKFSDCMVARGIEYSVHSYPRAVIPCLSQPPGRTKFHLRISSLRSPIHWKPTSCISQGGFDVKVAASFRVTPTQSGSSRRNCGAVLGIGRPARWSCRRLFLMHVQRRLIRPNQFL